MLSLANIKSVAQAGSYFEQDDYYIQEKGHWFGKGAEELGLSGEVSKEAFESILSGRDPKTGELMIRADDSHRPGTDLTFSASKSVSIMAIADPRILEAHRRAVAETLTMIERDYAGTRLGAGGREKIHTGNLIVARFDHITSRELDPQLHTHCVVTNMTQGPDGKWRTINNEEIFKNVLYLSQSYRNQLAMELRELGYTIEWSDKGLFEIKGVDQDLITEFSQRRAQVEAMAEELLKKNPSLANLPKGKLYEMATLESRQAKPKELDRDWLHQGWKDRIEAHGLTIETVQAVARAQVDGQTSVSPQKATQMALEMVTDKEAVFRKETLAYIALKLSLGSASFKEIEKEIGSLEAQGKLLTKGDGRYTTPEMLEVEKAIVELANKSLNTREAVASGEELKEILQKYTPEKGIKKPIELSDGQCAAVEHVLSSNDSVILLQGYAGVGKTFMLQTLKSELEAKGYAIKGAAFTGKAALEMSNAGVKSSTIDSFLREKDVTTGKEIWFIDEASMVGGKKALELMQKAKDQNATLIFMGDQEQLQSISAIGSFSLLQKKMDREYAEIKNIVRQQEDWYKEVVSGIAGFKVDVDGKILPVKDELEREKLLKEAFEKLDGLGKIHGFTDNAEMRKQVVSDYLEAQKKGSAVILVDTNKERTLYNTEARHLLKGQGKLEKEVAVKVTVDKGLSGADRLNAKNYEVGDKVVPDQEIGNLRKYQEAKVVSVNREKGTITVETERMRRKGFRKVEIEKAWHEIDLKKEGHRLTVYQEKEIGLAKGDHIIITKNAKSLGKADLLKETAKEERREKVTAALKPVSDMIETARFNSLRPEEKSMYVEESRLQRKAQIEKVIKKQENLASKLVNGRQATVKSIDHHGNITIVDEKKQKLTFSLKDFNHIDHSYALTAEKSQGGTWRSVLDTTTGDRNKKYVTATRGTHDLTMYTTDKDKMIERAMHAQEKSSALEYLDGMFPSDKIAIKDKQRDRGTEMGL